MPSILMAQLPVPENIGDHHPRAYGNEMSREELHHLIKNEDCARQIVEGTKDKLAKYLKYTEEEPDWLYSRLQMYWNSKATDVYIRGGVFDHAEGEAPVPTVKFPGTRDHTTNYSRPPLEDIKPYMDDPKGLYYINKETGEMEWTSIVSTSRNLESINRDILKISRDAAFMYWFTQEEKYARLAYGVLDTYLKGLYYRNEPIDLSHGHHQTLVGLTSFEVIQEHHVAEVTEAYDFLYGYVKQNHPENLKLYSDALKKWADQIIKNGVSFNNWNLFQAGHVSRIALVLENDSEYDDGKGAQYYLDQIMNQTSVRQWSMTKLVEHGYDPETGIWNESPGYSLTVLNDFIHFAEFFDHNFDIDFIEEVPVLKKAVKNSVQYLFPNGFKVGFGDGHYSKIDPDPTLYMIENARKFDKPEEEIYFTKMLKTFFDKEVYSGEFVGRNIQDLFAEDPLKVSDTIRAGKMNDFISPLFYAQNTSWLVQRSGEGRNSLMISQIGSLGNHMHSNGIAMELYGKGMPLAPEMGHGSSYFSIEYAEYYTQFPAHNTVIVNGRSKYPEMKSNHPFRLNSNYPDSGEQQGILPGYTFSDVSFLEPETSSDQRRLMGIIETENGGYYIDVFRSKQNNGNDIKHEYFYHNLGQSIEIQTADGGELNMQPTSKMAFGDGDLMAYDYMWDKNSVQTVNDLKGKFTFDLEDRIVNMNFWAKGDSNREIFSAKGPKSTAFRHGPIPEKYNDLPVPTLVIRQNGQAWTQPFVVIYEPAENNTSGIKKVDYFGEAEKVGIHVTSVSDREDFILSNISKEDIFKYEDMSLKGTYGIVSRKGGDFTLFLGNGSEITSGDYGIKTIHSNGAASLSKIDNTFFFSSDVPVKLTMFSKKELKNPIFVDDAGNTYKGEYNKDTKQIIFDLPVLPYQQIKISTD
ncbi:heparinase II/III domain-containing protein [Autumnicola psychrophila]|uniref:Heparinase II/III family protein n=1 Tax=Autumnicola psychrophila TaxID=3075592 RepID=A0ABU3DLZ2_9FLAO|nr:heparinase II/III family protein [Zunongwangia sp. F225]MDT0684742.1 heparinase II/III family protein [Zunongwangia sp. F225]